MRTAVQLTADAAPWPDLVAYVVEAERMGVDMVWVAEAWGSDAASPLGYLAARTSRIQLGSGVFQLGVRSAGDDRADGADAGRDVGQPVRARARHVGPTGDGRAARRSVRPPARADARDARRDPPRVRRRAHQRRR